LKYETNHFRETGRAARFQRGDNLTDLLVGQRIDQLDELHLVVRGDLTVTHRPNLKNNDDEKNVF
jgi:hypothetical protein